MADNWTYIDIALFTPNDLYNYIFKFGASYVEHRKQFERNLANHDYIKERG